MRHPALRYLADLYNALTDHRWTLTAGGVSYYLVLAVAPMAYAAGAIGGLFLTRMELQRAFDWLANRAPSVIDANGTLETSLIRLLDTGAASITVQSVLAVLLALFAASNVVVGVRTGLDDAFGVPLSKRGAMVRPVATFAALIGLLAFVAIATAMVVAPRVLSALDDYTTTVIRSGFGWVNWIVAFVLVGVVARWLFRHGPHLNRGNCVPVPWSSPGVWLTAVWVTGTTWLLGAYVQNAGALSTALLVFGAVVVLMLWSFAVTLGLLVGAEVEAARLRAAGWQPPARGVD